MPYKSIMFSCQRTYQPLSYINEADISVNVRSITSPLPFKVIYVLFIQTMCLWNASVFTMHLLDFEIFDISVFFLKMFIFNSLFLCYLWKSLAMFENKWFQSKSYTIFFSELCALYIILRTFWLCLNINICVTSLRCMWVAVINSFFLFFINELCVKCFNVWSSSQILS